MQATEMCLAIDSPGQINANRICICKGSLSVFVTLKKKEKKKKKNLRDTWIVPISPNLCFICLWQASIYRVKKYYRHE